MGEPGAAFTRTTVQVAGSVVRYAEARPANPWGTVVSIPGSAGLEMSTAKDRLAERYRVLELNPPGWGDEAEIFPPLPQNELGVLLAEAVEFLVDEAFLLLGTSMGGTNALYLAAQLPERVLGIVLEAPMAPRRPEDLRPQVTGAPQAHPKKPWATPDFVAHQMANRLRMIQATPPDPGAAAAVAVVRERGIPVLALLGSEDEILRPSLLDHLRDVLPHGEFRLIDGGWHDLQNTTPEEFVDLVEGFLERSASAAPGR